MFWFFLSLLVFVLFLALSRWKQTRNFQFTSFFKLTWTIVFLSHDWLLSRAWPKAKCVSSSVFDYIWHGLDRQFNKILQNSQIGCTYRGIWNADEINYAAIFIFIIILGLYHKMLTLPWNRILHYLPTDQPLGSVPSNQRQLHAYVWCLYWHLAKWNVNSSVKTHRKQTTIATKNSNSINSIFLLIKQNKRLRKFK